MSSAGAIWAILWRAVLWFPICFALWGARLAAVMALLYGFLFLLFQAVANAIVQEWWKAAACVLTALLVSGCWRVAKRYLITPFEGENLSGRGGGLL